ncbi:hypothetical protein RJ641_025674 [Dillenia turbinata]|uniref:Uncharacterized protein n=1 Tax=Dillenia turbinata TaxID=194707 RepID=A0AAN8WA94_9MAGN
MVKWRSLSCIIGTRERRDIGQSASELQTCNYEGIKYPFGDLISSNNEKDLKDNLNSSSLNIDELEGLPCPPMDKDFLLMGVQPEMDLSGFFDGIEDDGNICDINECATSPKSVQTGPKLQQPRSGKDFDLLKSLYLQNDKGAEKVDIKKDPATINLKKRPYSALDDSASTEATKMAAPVKRSRCQDANNMTKTGLATVGVDKVCSDYNNNCQKKVQVDRQKQTIDMGQLDEVSKELKLKESVMKLHKSYNVRKHKQVQMIDVCDLPKNTNCAFGQHRKKRFSCPLADIRDFCNAPNGLSKQSLTVNERLDNDMSQSPLAGKTKGAEVTSEATEWELELEAQLVEARSIIQEQVQKFSPVK